MGNYTQPEFKRPDSTFRKEVTAGEAGRYHLYISLACPWASRTLLVRNLRKLQDVISLSIVDPVWNDAGWYFSENEGCIPDFVNHQKDLISIYHLVDPTFSGDETVPILWDKKEKAIVNNESREIIRMFDTAFMNVGDPQVCFAPEKLIPKIDEAMDRLYPYLNNGVYRAGFARAQGSHEKAVKELFRELEYWDALLAKNEFLVGSQMTEADICFFTTLIRFEAVYAGHFKCNLFPLTHYQHVHAYLLRLYRTPGVKETVNFDHIKRHYYMSQTFINPSRVVPIGPILDWA